MGRTILTVMHGVNFAAGYSDHICAMMGGQIAAFGTAEERMDAQLLIGILGTRIEIFRGRPSIWT